nr:MAG TPA: hypothetical protein [Caudoviricetes sp.]
MDIEQLAQERYEQVEKDKNAALKENEQLYGQIRQDTDKYYTAQVDAAKQWADKQTEIQNQQNALTQEKLQQQKDKAQEGYQKEQQGAYIDWQKQSDRHGVQAEQAAAGGVQNSGFAESTLAGYYNTYQNRVATARQTYQDAVFAYDNAMKEAALRNSAALAEIAYKTLQTSLSLSLQMFQYKNQMAISQAEKKQQLDALYYDRFNNVPNQVWNEKRMYDLIAASGGGGGGGYHGPNTTRRDRAKKQAQILKEQEQNGGGNTPSTGKTSSDDDVKIVSANNSPYSEKALVDMVNKGQATATFDGPNRFVVTPNPHGVNATAAQAGAAIRKNTPYRFTGIKGKF